MDTTAKQLNKDNRALVAVPPLKAFIVEKEIMGRDSFSLLLKKYFPEIVLMGVVSDVNSACNLIATLNPDVVFLDIELNNGACGFQVMENLYGRNNYYFIVISDVDSYALKAISKGVTDYLLRPFELGNVVVAVDKVRSLIISRAQQLAFAKAQQHETIIESSTEDTNVEILAIPSTNKIDLIKKRDIVYLKAEGRYTKFLLKDDSNKIASKNLGEFEGLLNPGIFFRVHHSFIVNIMYVSNINKSSGNYLEMEIGGKSIPVAKRKLDALNRFLKIK